ncbi:MAG: cyanoexosortase A system-associated protein [Cyanobacteria bacterium P01_F01_bin.4]
MKNIGQLVRLGTLTTMACGATLVAGRVLFYPAQPKVVDSSFQFPAQVSLADSNPSQGEVITFAADAPEFFVSGHRYQVQYDNRPVAVEMRYLIHPNAELMELIEQYLEPEQTVQRDAIAIKQSPDLGSYLLYSDQGQAYLSACINPYGTSTVTDQEFKYNRNFYDIRYRLWPWLTGENLKDERCLWAHLSTPLGNDPQAAQKALEQVWPDWYEWWQAEFPPLYAKQV